MPVHLAAASLLLIGVRASHSTLVSAMVTRVFRMFLPASFICPDQSFTADISSKTFFLIKGSRPGCDVSAMRGQMITQAIFQS